MRTIQSAGERERERWTSVKRGKVVERKRYSESGSLDWEWENVRESQRERERECVHLHTHLREQSEIVCVCDRLLGINWHLTLDCSPTICFYCQRCRSNAPAGQLWLIIFPPLKYPLLATKCGPQTTPLLLFWPAQVPLQFYLSPRWGPFPSQMWSHPHPPASSCSASCSPSVTWCWCLPMLSGLFEDT